MDDLLKKAKEHRQRAIQQRDELSSIIRSLDEFIAAFEKAAAGRKYRGDPGSALIQADLFSGFVSRAERVQHVARMMDAAEELIITAQRPLTRSELLSELERRGFQVEGADKSKVLGTNLWRSKRFDNLKGAGYWPKGTPLPEAFANLRPRPSMLDEK
ncbi:hypothetical protein ACFB49_43030 [Sphingomonas sp. DBB INV C78]|uniref:hypothetical protein n=1 Tax=Sphingomonas sp. DBB INV C78 TaxID=3349434 RepID=UPI0036D2D3FF